MSQPILNFLAIILLTFLARCLGHSGFQSGSKSTDGANTFASAMKFDSKRSLLYITGATYSSFWGDAGDADASDCFLTVLKVPPHNNLKEENMEMLYLKRFGKGGHHEACSSIAFHPSPFSNDNIVRLVTLGHTHEGGLLTSLRGLGTPKSTVYGFLLSHQLEIVSSRGAVREVGGKVEGGRLIDERVVQYPVAITVDPIAGDDSLYVAALASTSGDETTTDILTQPDQTVGGGLIDPQYGKDFDVFVGSMKHKSKKEIEYLDDQISMYGGKDNEGGVKETIKGAWSEYFSPYFLPSYNMSEYYDYDDGYYYPFNDVQVADLAYLPQLKDGVRADSTLLVGTVVGFGKAFGGQGFGIQGFSTDGYITKLSISDGSVEAFARLKAFDEGDTKIKGVCLGPGTSEEFFYVVGETSGQLDEDMTEMDFSYRKDGMVGTQAFLSKFSVATLEHIWTKQIGSVNGQDVTGYGCAVPKDGTSVYMAGTIENDDILKAPYGMSVDSAGGDDIFVMSHDAENGSPMFAKQFGTSKDDSLAKGSGVACDEDGNALLLGNSRGSMMRWRGDKDGPSDIFVVSVAKGSGKMRLTSEMLKGNLPENKPMDPKEEKGNSFISELFVVILLTLLLFFLIFKNSNIRRSKGESNLSDLVSDYLSGFKSSKYDLHLRQSATGGIHGIYSKKGQRLVPTEIGVMPDEETLVRNNVTSPSPIIDADTRDLLKEAQSLSATLPKRREEVSSYIHVQPPSMSEKYSYPSRPVIPPSSAFTIDDEDDNDSAVWGKEII